MTTKKIVLIVVSVVVALGLIVAIFVAGIVGMAFYQMANSDAAKVSEAFLQNSERLKQDIGEVKSFGRIVTGNINLGNGEGIAELNLKVVGERKTVNATVSLIFREGHQWQVTEAYYRDDAGKTVDLLSAYDAHNFTTRLAA